MSKGTSNNLAPSEKKLRELYAEIEKLKEKIQSSALGIPQAFTALR